MEDSLASESGRLRDLFAACEAAQPLKCTRELVEGLADVLHGLIARLYERIGAIETARELRAAAHDAKRDSELDRVRQASSATIDLLQAQLEAMRMQMERQHELLTFENAALREDNAKYRSRSASLAAAHRKEELRSQFLEAQLLAAEGLVAGYKRTPAPAAPLRPMVLPCEARSCGAGGSQHEQAPPYRYGQITGAGRAAGAARSSQSDLEWQE